MLLVARQFQRLRRRPQNERRGLKNPRPRCRPGCLIGPMFRLVNVIIALFVGPETKDIEMVVRHIS
jgi:hypothetical protein